MRYEILMDYGETANKCTIAPLAGRPDFQLFPVFGEGPLGPLSAPILLHHEGRCLADLAPTLKTPSALAAIDCVWRRLPKITHRIRWLNGKDPILARIPMGIATAYPRVGLPHQDPMGGLATIEAIFIASALLGHWDVSLLSEYFFGRRFIEGNADRLTELGVPQASHREFWPDPKPLVRTSQSRRRNRGRAGR